MKENKFDPFPFIMMILLITGVFIFWILSINKEPEVETGERYFLSAGIMYVSAEKKDCKEKGGVFRIYPSFTDYDYSGYSITCTKSYKEGSKDITETIFDYKI